MMFSAWRRTRAGPGAEPSAASRSLICPAHEAGHQPRMTARIRFRTATARRCVLATTVRTGTSCSSLAAAAVGRHAPGRAGSVTPASWCRRARLLRYSRQVRWGSQDLLRAPNRRQALPPGERHWNQPPRGVIGGHARGPQIAAVLDGRADQACSLGGRTDRTIGTQRCGHGLSSGLLPARTVMQPGPHLLRVAAGGTRR